MYTKVAFLPVCLFKKIDFCSKVDVLDSEWEAHWVLIADQVQQEMQLFSRNILSRNAVVRLFGAFKYTSILLYFLCIARSAIIT